MAGCRSGILRRNRHSQSWRRLRVVPVWDGLNPSNSYSTGNLWSKRIDTKGPWIRWLSSWWCDAAAAKRRADSNYVCPVWKVLGKSESLADFPQFGASRKKWSRLNRISHPNWVKICVKHNGQFNLCAKPKYEVLSATKVTVTPIVVGAFRTISKGLVKGLEDLEIRGRVKTFQNTALLRLARILRRALETQGDLMSLKLQWETTSVS